jgi:protein-S-isoprenylcysteine O-methyltransferase Ste14
LAADRDGGGDSAKTVGRAAFLGGLLAFCSLVGLSVVGVGHSRTIEGAANAQFWIVAAIAFAATAAATYGLARERARSPAGEVARRAGVALACLWLAIFLWESVATGAVGYGGPFELAWAAWKN